MSLFINVGQTKLISYIKIQNTTDMIDYHLAVNESKLIDQWAKKLLKTHNFRTRKAIKGQTKKV